MVAEVVPDDKRVESGALLYTAAALGLFLATWVNFQVAGVWYVESPETSWRIVFLFGLIPALVAFVVRLFVKEPERWSKVQSEQPRPRMRDLFSHEIRGITIRGTMMAVIALIGWWSCNAFIPTVALVPHHSRQHGARAKGATRATSTGSRFGSTCNLGWLRRQEAPYLFAPVEVGPHAPGGPS